MKMIRRSVVRWFLAILLACGVYQCLQLLGELRLVSTLQLHRSLQLHIQQWKANLLHNNYALDTDPRFVQEVQSLLQHHHNDPEFWFTTPAAELPLLVEVPAYYSDTSPRPRLQPFDPRLTLLVYFHWIAHHPDSAVDFHWSDWVDLLNLNRFLYNNGERNKCENLFDISNNEELIQDSDIKDIKLYCRNHYSTPLGFKITANPGQQTIENNEIIGKSFLYTSFEPPSKIVLLTDEGDYEIAVNNRENSMKYGLLHNRYIEELKLEQAHVVDSFNTMIQRVGKPHTPKPQMHAELKLHKSMFAFDAAKRIHELEAQALRTLNEEMYLNSLKYSLLEEDPPKYFNEAKLLNSIKENWLGEHYDWRFFNGITVGKTEQMISLYKLIRLYLELCVNEGLVTWISHGTLLSWYWNGLIFPWDTDLDVQMPIAELNRLAERFNQSLVVENVNRGGSFNGMGKYFVDVSSSITYRQKGNGRNNIDGRFIDVDTGLYVDITGLALTNTEAPQRYDYLTPQFSDTSGTENLKKNFEFGLVNCRNNHFVKIDEVDTLKPIHFQDQLSYLSDNFLVMLDAEYVLDSLTEKNYRDFYYLNNFRIWTDTQNILDYLKDPSQWVAAQQGDHSGQNSKRIVGTLEKLQINKLSYEDYLNLLQDKRILRDYVLTKNNSFGHFNELRNLLFGKSLPVKFASEYTLDLFLSRVYEGGWDYAAEVATAVELEGIFLPLVPLERERQGLREKEALALESLEHESQESQGQEESLEQESPEHPLEQESHEPEHPLEQRVEPRELDRPEGPEEPEGHSIEHGEVFMAVQDSPDDPRGVDPKNE